MRAIALGSLRKIIDKLAADKRRHLVRPIAKSRSRGLAETALANAAEETMDELVANDRVEVFIQEIIEAQTVGIVDEITERP